jgi:hypothetical protein
MIFFYLDDARNALESQFDAPETSGCKCGLLLYHFHSPKTKSENKIRALLLVLLPSTHKTSKFFSFSLSCLNPDSPNLNLQKLSKDLTPQNSTGQPKKKHSLQGFRFTKITQNQTIEIHTVYRSRVKYIPSAQRVEKSREAKRRDEAAKKEKQNNGERERDRGKKRSLGE